MGRTSKRASPTQYSQGVADELCMRMSQGETVTDICKEERMPVWETVWRWRQVHPDFDVQYQKAREDQTHAWADQVVGMMDSAVPDKVTMNKNDPRWTLNKDGGITVSLLSEKHMTHVKEMIRVRQWVMAKVSPFHYGDKKMIHNTYDYEQKTDGEILQNMIDTISGAGLSIDDFADLLKAHQSTAGADMGKVQ